MAKGLRLLLWISAVGVASLTALAQLDRLRLGEAGWLFDLFAHFPRHLAVAAAGVAIFSALVRLWRPAGLAVAAVVICAGTTLNVPRYATATIAPAGVETIRVVSANVHGDPQALARLAALANTYGANLVSIYEAPALTDDALHDLFPGAMTLELVRQTPDGGELSKKLIVAASSIAGDIEVTPGGGRSNRAILRYRLQAAKGAIQIVATHPVTPGSPAGLRDRNRMLSSLRDRLDESSPFVVMGDFNTTSWAGIFHDIPGTRAGDPRFETTFPAQLPLLGIPIDHIMFGGGLSLVNYQVGPNIGSDHQPIFATFALPSRTRMQ